MMLHVFVFLLVVCLLLSLALLWGHDWLHHQPSLSRGGAKRSRLPRVLKPRSPDDCPACRLASTPSSGAGPSPLPVRPWREVKSRQGAPKRIDTEGFACPNPQCRYFGNTDAHSHALVGDGKHGKANPIQTFRCQACRTTFTSRRNTPLVPTENPFPEGRHGAVCAGLRARPIGDIAGLQLRQATIITWLTRAGKHAELFHERCFRNLHLPHLQLDEIRT